MQTIPGYPTDTSSLKPVCVVRVGGVPVGVDSVSLARDLPSVLPAQAVTVGGITAATGDIGWANGELSSTRSPNPWGNGVPEPGDDVEIEFGYEGFTARQLTGFIDGSNGDVRSGSMSSAVVDGYDQFNTPITIPPQLGVMPGIAEGTATRNANLTPTHITDRIMRAAGFYATPPRSGGCVFSAPLMGSTWPELGTLTQSSAWGEPTFNTSFSTSAWGQAADSADVTWEPNLSLKSGALNETFQMTFMLGPAKTSGNVVFAVNWGSATIRIAATASRNISAQLINGGTTTVCTLTNTAGLGADTFMLRVNTGGNFTIYANNGATATGTTTLPAAITGGPITSIRLTTPALTAPIVGGLQVSFSTNQTYAYTRTAFLTPSAHRFGLTAYPGTENVPAVELLTSQSEAELAGTWLDSYGRARWVNRTILKGATPVMTLTAKENLLDLSWQYTAAALVSRVDISHSRPEVSGGSRTTKLAWQGSGESMSAGDVVEEIATPASGTDWIMVDESLDLAGSTTGDGFNRGCLSYGGGIETDGTTERWAQLLNPGFGVDIEKLGIQSYKLTTTAGTPTSGYSVELRVVDEGTTSATWRRWRNEKLPMLRCKRLVTWIDETIIGAITGLPKAKVLTHDVGHWIQDPEALTDVQSELAAELASPNPVLNNIPIVPDPRLERGDVVWVEDENNLGVRLKVLVTGLNDTSTPGSWDQSISGLIISVERISVTNQELDDHAAAYTNEAFDSLWADATNAEFDTNPLGRG